MKYLDTGDIAGYWGDGNFMCLKVSDVPTGTTSVKVGLRPTYGGPGGTTPIDDDSGLVEILGDPDMNGVFMVNDKDTQKFIIVSTDGVNTSRKEYSLSGLVCNAS